MIFAWSIQRCIRATTLDKSVAQTKGVLKQYQEKASTAIKNDLGMSLEDHTRKQVQMNAVARHLTKKIAKNAPPEFCHIFEYFLKCFLMCLKNNQLPLKSM